jgi:hypothetical protein
MKPWRDISVFIEKDKAPTDVLHLSGLCHIVSMHQKKLQIHFINAASLPNDTFTASFIFNFPRLPDGSRAGIFNFQLTTNLSL